MRMWLLSGFRHTRHLCPPSRADTTPRAIRESLRKYSDTFYTGENGVRSLEGLAITDAGDVENPDDDREGAVIRLRELVSQSSLVIALGGDNSATVPVATASLDRNWDTAGLITLDAHFDVRTGKSNGSPVRELIELGLPGPHIAQLGIADLRTHAHIQSSSPPRHHRYSTQGYHPLEFAGHRGEGFPGRRSWGRRYSCRYRR